METTQTVEIRGGLYMVGSDSERLALILSHPEWKAGPTPEQARKAAEGEARAKVEADSRLGVLRDRAVTAMRESAEVGKRVAEAYRDMKPERYSVWLADRREEHARALIVHTQAFRSVLGAFREAYELLAVPMATVATEMLALQTRLRMLDAASPELATELVADAIQRRDLPFLHAAAFEVRSWLGHRNAWSGVGEKVGRELLERIDAATWSSARAMAEHAKGLAERYENAWRTIVAELAANYRVDSSYLATGALAPLIEVGG